MSQSKVLSAFSQARLHRGYGSPSRRGAQGKQAGFSLMELAIAILILIVGITAVAQLIPAAMESNFRNRYDSSGMIFAQRQLEQMVAQDIEVGNPAALGHYGYIRGDVPNPRTCGGAAIAGTPPLVPIRLGLNSPAAGCTPPSANPAIPANCSDFGAAIITDPSGGNLVIDWTQPGTAVPYCYQSVSREGYLYETRWRVMTIFTPISGVTRPVAKRILLSTRGGPPGVAAPPTTFVTWTVWR